MAKAMSKTRDPIKVNGKGVFNSSFLGRGHLCFAGSNG